MTAAAQKDYVKLYSPYSHDVHDDPYPYYKALRDEAPVYYNATDDYYILSRFDDVQMAMRDFKRFSSHEGVALEADRTLGGLCDWIEPEAPASVDLPIEGAAALKAAIITVVLHYTTTGPLA